MSGIFYILDRESETLNRLLVIWESSVRATHTFLSQNEIVNLRADVRKALAEVAGLYVYADNTSVWQGFLGVAGNKIEMLFIDAGARGKGLGKLLLQYAFNSLNAKYVDVNEQNESGVGFYRHMGFHIFDRSAYDGQGRPFPILHMEYRNGVL